MIEKTKAWDTFIKTGKVEDYLEYKRIILQEKKEKDNSGVF